MNGVLIAFLVIVIITAIYIVAQFYDPSYLIRDSSPLNILKSSDSSNSSNKSQYSINVTEFDNPGSNRYFYEGWFYINSNAPVSSTNVLFNRGDDFIVALNGSTLNLYVNAKPASGTRVSSEGVVDMSNIKSPLISVPNFPFQKWCHLVINVDGLSVDLYVDGKFVKNVKNNEGINVSTTDHITYGNHYTDGYVARFRRMDKSINPQGVWNNYMLGSGQSISISNYHVHAQITKNKSVRIDQRII
jgi:hypothetical protein